MLQRRRNAHRRCILCLQGKKQHHQSQYGLVGCAWAILMNFSFMFMWFSVGVCFSLRIAELGVCTRRRLHLCSWARHGMTGALSGARRCLWVAHPVGSYLVEDRRCSLHKLVVRVSSFFPKGESEYSCKYSFQ